MDDDRTILGKKVDRVIPNSLLPHVLATGRPILFDLMEYPQGWCAVSRFPLKDEQDRIIGAFGFVLFDNLNELQPVLNKIQTLQRELKNARSELLVSRRAKYSFGHFSGSSEKALEVKRRGRIAANQNTTVLLCGETGTGKELIAQAIHAASDRATNNFVAVNVGAIPDSLMEAEFFGAAPGAYTGASQKKRIGKMELANNGTLFLDEIGDMPLAMQVKLLRALQEREIEPLGSNRMTKIDIRVIAATSKNLEEMVNAGQFRADLYYRLNVIPIDIAPLRERMEDIPVLCEYLLDEIAVKLNRSALQIDKDALSLLCRYHWPGNVRELHNILERAVVLNEGPLVRAADIRQALPANIPKETKEELPAFPGGRQRITMAEAVKALEKQLIENALVQKQGNKAAAAEWLDMPKSTFYMKLREL